MSEGTWASNFCCMNQLIYFFEFISLRVSQLFCNFDTSVLDKEKLKSSWCNELGKSLAQFLSVFLKTEVRAKLLCYVSVSYSKPISLITTFWASSFKYDLLWPQPSCLHTTFCTRSSRSRFLLVSYRFSNYSWTAQYSRMSLVTRSFLSNWHSLSHSVMNLNKIKLECCMRNPLKTWTMK